MNHSNLRDRLVIAKTHRQLPIRLHQQRPLPHSRQFYWPTVFLVLCAACTQSPWSARQAQLPTNTVTPTTQLAADNATRISTSPSDWVVRGQEPIRGTLVSTANAPAAAAPSGRDFDAGTLIAVVGTEHVLAGDMHVFVEPILEKNRGKMTPEQEKELRANLVRQALSQYVEIKALYQEFFRDMVGNKPPKDVAEMQSKVTTKAAQIFHDKQVPMMQQKYKVDDIAALERKLQEKSMSLATLQTQFTERVLSSELERKYVPDEYEFSRAELLAYYEDHDSEWNVIGRVKWRELCVRFNLHSREEAEAIIKNMGNEVYLGGKPFEAVAKQQSEGFTASAGGLHDWTTQGSLRSKTIDQALFSLPLRRLSQVIEDELGFHIIEVLEREPGHKKTFDSAQAEIRKRMSEAKRSKLLDEFHTKVMARTSIWTLWPEDIPNSRALSEALGEDYQSANP